MPTQITLSQMREHLYAAVVADALDSVGLRRQSPSIPLRPISCEDKVLVGRCRTSLWVEMFHEDPKPYELELRAVDSCQPDDVLICAAHGAHRTALWGELLSTCSQNTGCVGAIVDGSTRDVSKIRAMGFQVFARGTSVYDSLNRQRAVDLDVPVEIDGVKFTSGDLVIADIDGIVVVPQDVEAEVIDRAWKKVHTENRIRDAIRGGMKAQTAFETFGTL